MASFGRTLVRGLGAAMQGLGAGVIAQEQQNERQRAAAAAREAAMEELRVRFQYNERAADNESARIMKRAEKGAEIAVGQHRATRMIDQPYEIAREERQAGRDQAAEERAQRNREAMARLNSSLNMSEAAQRAAIELNSALTLAGQTVERYETTTDGRIVALNGRGQVINQTASGLVAPDAPRGGGANTPLPRRGEAATPSAPSSNSRTIRYDAEGRRIGG